MTLPMLAHLSDLSVKATPSSRSIVRPLYEEELIPLAIRGFLIVGAFVVIPVVVARSSHDAPTSMRLVIGQDDE